jgi:hypothetical protein
MDSQLGKKFIVLVGIILIQATADYFAVGEA